MRKAGAPASAVSSPAGDLAEPPGIGRGWPATILLSAGVLVAYLGLERVSLLHEYQGLPITPWNPALGMMFAVILLAGPSAAILLLIGVLLSELVVLDSRLPWPIILAIAVVVSASYAAAAAVARRWLRLDTSLVHLRDVLALGAAGVGGAVVVAAALPALLVAAGRLARDELLPAATTLLVGDVLGVAVMTPLLLLFARHRPHLSLRRIAALAPELVVYGALIAVSLGVIARAGADGPKFFYLLFLPVVAAAVRHGFDGACLGLVATQLSLVGLLHTYGYDARAFTEFQALMFVLTGAGLIVGMVVTERRSADRRARIAESRLRERENEAAEAARHTLLSSMAAALAHEINQPLTAARALGRSAQHLLQTPLGDLPRADVNLTAMIAQIDHAAEVVRRMREFLRRGRPHVSTIDVRTMLEDALMLVKAHSLAKDVAIELNVAPDAPVIHGDRVQLQQVVLNLVTNAMEAMSAVPANDRSVRVAAWPDKDRTHMILAVADSGPGIEPLLAERLFEPLLSSKPEGLGLGLAICASIVEAHGGRVWLESRAPGATEFRVSLPTERSRS